MKRPLSMTSFGRGESADGAGTWTVEIRSVNHRYCDVAIKIPRQYAALEERIKKEVMTRFSRGRIDVNVGRSGDLSDSLQLQVNLPLAGEYHQCLQILRKEFSLEETPDIAMLAGFKDVITARDKEEDLDAVWPPVREALSNAMHNGLHMREKEGEALKKDILERVRNVSMTVSDIEAAVPGLVGKKESALKERLDNLLKGVDIDPVRLAQEVAIMADKADITEELVRLHSHIEQCNNFFDLDEPIGRRLDFLMQEFLREINTMASKIGDASVTHQTVYLKNEVEKIREQVQNLE